MSEPKKAEPKVEEVQEQPKPGLDPNAAKIFNPDEVIEDIIEEFDEDNFDEEFDDDFEEEVKGEYNLEDDQYGEEFNEEFGHLTSEIKEFNDDTET